MNKAYAKNGKNKSWTEKLPFGCALAGVMCASLVGTSVSALTYQEEVPVSFTFNGGLSVSLSSADLIITNLVPGTTDDSNIITVTTSSNLSSGYTLYATVGNSTTYNSRNLTNNDNVSNIKTIDSLATSASLASMSSADASSNGKWGYSFSTNNGTSWSAYSGLPLYTAETGKELIAVNSNATSAIKFKIGAKSATNQAAGEYKNIINFIAVANPEPEEGYYMQNVSDWGSELEVGDEIEAIDLRDNKSYYVARLEDGNIWMIQNLDFDIPDSGADLDSTNTDVPSSWTDAGNLTDTYAANDTTWIGDYYAPESYDPGDVCWNGTIDTSYSGTLSNMTTTCTDRHYHIGNYYSWTAAVAMSYSGSYTIAGTDVDQSICPAGWTLPKDGSNTGSGSYTGSGSFTYLVNQASLTAGTSGNIHQAPNYFVYGGHWYAGSHLVGGYGRYWSSVVSNDYDAYELEFHTDGFLSNYADSRDGGLSVRCVAR